MSAHGTFCCQTPLGRYTLVWREHRLVALQYSPTATPGGPDDPLARRTVRQLSEYFAGQRRSFSLPLLLLGTPFQRRVWRALAAIPYGETRSYGELARAIGRPGAARAVGGACHRNPLALILPCHRVLGQGGALTGYAGGLAQKAALLQLEQRHRPDRR